MKYLAFLFTLLLPLSVLAQSENVAKLSLKFINGIDSEVSIQQMPNPGSNLKHDKLLARIDSATEMAHFEFELDGSTDFYWISSVNELGSQLTLKPGDDLLMTIDKEEGYSSMTFQGIGAEWNNFYRSINHEQQGKGSEIFHLAQEGKASFSEITAMKMALLEETLKMIDERSLKKEYGNDLIEVFKLDETYETYMELFLYQSWFKMDLAPSDLEFLRQIPVANDKAATSSRMYLDLVSRYLFFHYYKDHPKKDIDQETYAEQIFSGETLETWKADRIISSVQRGYAPPEAIEKAKNELTRPDVLRDLEMAELQFERSQISEFDPNTHFIEGEFERLADVIKLFEGKVIYVDFWGSWCGPCILNMPRNLRIQKEFAGKEVVFLFLAGRDQEKYWKRAIKKNQISGYHLLMDDQMLAEANEMFGMIGFPTHGLIDKKGNIVDKDPGKRPTKELFAKIEALLK